ncbi:Syntaxin-binding protein 5-like [Goodea atripinnis]|uniref:Syntaxin-binding protein 5-like n=1 Tax=Goodea atripinnis TaxID=208336 RepID=A0ABV0MPN9_9TELE
MGPEGPRLTRRGPGRPPFRKAQSTKSLRQVTKGGSLHGRLNIVTVPEMSQLLSYTESLCTPTMSTTPLPRTAGTREVRGFSRHTNTSTAVLLTCLRPSVRMSTRLVALCHLNVPLTASSCLGRCTNRVGHVIFIDEPLNPLQVLCSLLLLCRSRSSSVSSIDRDTKEAITTLQFGESYGRKSDALPTPCLWVGTSLGVVILIPLSIPTDHEERMEDPVTVGPRAVQMLKGSVLRFGFLDCNGALIQSPYEVWRDLNALEDPDRPRRRKLVHFSPSSSQETFGEGHLSVVCSERQAKVFLMPSQSCLFVHNITESSFVLRADVVSLCNSVCLACFCANGHVMTLRYELHLRPLMDVNYLPLTDMRIARTFCFTNEGQALYLSSPTEIQRITYSQEMCDNLQGGVEGMKVAASGVVGELARARIALDERGQRLGELEERTALMMTSAETFSKHAHEVRIKDKI